VGIGTSSLLYPFQVAGSNATAVGYFNNSNANLGAGVYGLASGTTAGMIGVYGSNTSTAGGGGVPISYGVYGQASGAQSSSGAQHVGVYGVASGGSYNVAGYFADGGEFVMANSNTISATAQLPRSFAGSMFTQVQTAAATGGGSGGPAVVLTGM
jgi:hypothetical protein